MAYTIALAKSSGLYSGVYVSSDSQEYLEVAERYGAIGLSEEKTDDGKIDVEWVKEDFSQIDMRGVDAVAILRPTNPFRTVSMLSQSMVLFEALEADSLRAMELCRQHPHKMWTISQDVACTKTAFGGIRDHEKNYQQLPSFYIQNGALEMVWVETIEKYNNLTGEIVIPYVTHGYEGFDLNTAMDWILGEELCKEGLVNLPEVE